MAAKLLSTLVGHEDRVWNASWSHTGTLLATCGSDKTIRIWAEEGKGIWMCKSVLIDGHTRAVRCVSFSPCGRYLASASFDATVVIWELKDEEFEVMTTLEGHENEVKSCTWSVSGRYLATCSRDKSVWVWEIDEDEEFQCCSVVNAHSQDVKMIVWHPHIDLLASCSYDDTVKILEYDGDDWIVGDTLASHSSTVWSIAFDASGDRLASVSDDRTLKIWQRYQVGNKEGVVVTVGSKFKWKCVCTVSGFHNGPVYTVDWCHSTNLIATGCGDNQIRIFKQSETAAAEEVEFNIVCAIDAHLQDVNGVKFHPKIPGMLASASDDGTVKLWKIVTAESEL